MFNILTIMNIDTVLLCNFSSAMLWSALNWNQEYLYMIMLMYFPQSYFYKEMLIWDNTVCSFQNFLYILLILNLLKVRQIFWKGPTSTFYFSQILSLSYSVAELLLSIFIHNQDLCCILSTALSWVITTYYFSFLL